MTFGTAGHIPSCDLVFWYVAYTRAWKTAMARESMAERVLCTTRMILMRFAARAVLGSISASLCASTLLVACRGAVLSWEDMVRGDSMLVGVGSYPDREKMTGEARSTVSRQGNRFLTMSRTSPPPRKWSRQPTSAGT